MGPITPKVTAAAVAVVILAALLLGKVTAGDGSPRAYYPVIIHSRPPECDRHYPTVCIPPPPPDLNCDDIEYTDFTVIQPDPHDFDRDKDSIGCETN